MIRSRESGITLMEVIITVAVIGIVASVMTPMTSNIIRSFNTNTTREQLVNESRTTMDTMVRSLQRGVASSVVICSCPYPPAFSTGGVDCTTCSPPAGTPPYSRIQFNLTDGTPYAFYESGGSLFMAVGTRTPLSLASDVTTVMFVGDSTNPTQLGITLRLDRASDQSGLPDRQISVRLENQQVSLLAN